jgi:cephalosporin hydroxylase
MPSDNSDPIALFKQQVNETIESYKTEEDWKRISHEWLIHGFSKNYVYNFSALGRPIIQLPTDMVAFQEIVWDVKPDLIIETGIAHGGSLIQSAALLANLEYCEAVESGQMLDPSAPKRRVLGIDIDIRDHNRNAIEAHPMANRIDMIEGSSIDEDLIQQVKDIASGFSRVLVCLDSHHVHDHVLAELQSYAPLVSKGSYCLVFDTLVEDMEAGYFPNRPWAPGNSPKSAVFEYLKKLESEKILGADGNRLLLENDCGIDDKLFLTSNPNGYLRRR